MHLNFIAGSQAEIILNAEYLAIQAWTELMKQARLAIDYGSGAIAEKCLGAALEIGLLRYEMNDGQYFDERHILRPIKALFLHLHCTGQGQAASDLLKAVEAQVKVFANNRLLLHGIHACKQIEFKARLEASRPQTGKLKYPMALFLGEVL